MNCKLATFQSIARRLLTHNWSFATRRQLGICQYHLCHRQLDANCTNPTSRHQYPTGSWLQQSRNYAKKLSFFYSGDLTRRMPLEEKALVYNYKGLTATLEKAPPVVHQLSSLEYADGRVHKYHRLEEMYDRIEDLFGSNADLEQRIAKLTVDIWSLIPHCLKFRQDKFMKSRLVEKIQMRKKLLKCLRQHDYERFLWLLRELRIRYIPTPEYHGQVTRKFRKKRAVVRSAFEVRKCKLIELREHLEAERIQFEDYKKKMLTQIEKDIKALNLDRSLLEEHQSRQPMTKLEAKTQHLKHKPPTRS